MTIRQQLPDDGRELGVLVQRLGPILFQFLELSSPQREKKKWNREDGHIEIRVHEAAYEFHS